MDELARAGIGSMQNLTLEEMPNLTLEGLAQKRCNESESEQQKDVERAVRGQATGSALGRALLS